MSPRPRVLARLREILPVIVALVAVPSVCLAQAASASTLKAAFTLNFVKFTTWPDFPAGQPIAICVYADAVLAEAMTRAVAEQSVGGRTLRVKRNPPAGTQSECHLVFVAERDPRRLTAILEEASRLPVLVVSDVEESARPAITVRFFQENERLRFAINVDAMERSRVMISSRLLSLAKITHDNDLK